MPFEIESGDCLELIRTLAPASVDLVYVDPPFFTQKTHKLTNKDRTSEYAFEDRWPSRQDYISFLASRMLECKRVMRDSASLFFHCDATANYSIRSVLDEVFGERMFRAEIIWYYRRWSNSQRAPLPSHQTIYFYSKGDAYKYSQILESYSPSTNVDQIVQRRCRDEDGKSRYVRDEGGNPVTSGKIGVPISDVWDIPLLNPKATERTGYPTQKPLLLLERIIELVTEPGDVVLDPFCGSGTTLVAACSLGRSAIGFDISVEAVQLTKKRLLSPPVRSPSGVFERGRESYDLADKELLRALDGIPVLPVHRNKGIDALLRGNEVPGPVFFRVQRQDETLDQACSLLEKACKGKSPYAAVVIATNDQKSLFPSSNAGLHIIRCTKLAVKELLAGLGSRTVSTSNGRTCLITAER